MSDSRRTNPAVSGMGGYTLRKTDVGPAAERAKGLGKRIIDARLGDPTVFGLDPFMGYRVLVEDAVAKTRNWGYGNSCGLDALREVLGRGNAENGTNNYVIPPDRVFVGPGVSGVARALFQTLIDPAALDQVVIPKWSYIIYFAEAALSNAKVVNAALRRNGEVDVGSVKDSITRNTKAVFVTTVGNPLGVAMRHETFGELVRVVNEKEREFNHPICLVADTIYEGFRTGSDPLDPIEVSMRVGRHGPTIEVYSISKMIGAPGARLGWMRVYHNGEDFRAEVDGFLEALTTVFQPTLGLAPNAFQIGLQQLYEELQSGDRKWFDEFKGHRSKEVIKRTRDLLSMLAEIPGVVFPQYYYGSNGVEADRVHSPYVLFGVDKEVMPKGEVSQSRELADFTIDQGDMPAVLTTPADNFLAAELRGDPQEFMRAVALSGADRITQPVRDFVASRR